MDTKRYHIWNIDREYQGVQNHGTPPDCKYYLPIAPPECPEPEYADGWYLVYHKGYADEVKKLLRLEGVRMHDDRGKVVGSLSDYAFLVYLGEEITFLPRWEE